MSLAWRVAYLVYRIFSWVHYAGRRRFTKPGLMVLGALFVATLLGPDTENSVAYQAFTLLFAILSVALVFSWFFRVRFTGTRLLPRFGTVGHPLHYTVLLTNLGQKTQTGLALVEDLTDIRPPFRQWRAVQRAQDRQLRSFRIGQKRRKHPFKAAEVKEAEVAPVGPGQEVEVRAQLTPLRRGPLRFAGVTLARPDPLGLYRALARVPAPQSTLILPKRYPLPPIALPGVLKYQQGGVALASNVGQSEEFVALRDYRYGDPMRHIHWRSWAKAGKPVVKEFEDEFFVRHALVLDTFTDDPQDDLFEEAVSVAASFACTVLTQESLLDLLFVGPESYCFTAGRGLGQTDRMLEILAAVQACLDQPFDELERLVLQHATLLSGCICVLLAWDQRRQKFVEKLKMLGVPVLVLVLAAPGKAGSIQPGIMEGDAFRVLELGQIEQGLAKLR